MKLCQICKKKLRKIINFGNHPVSHKFNNGKFKTEKFPLILGQCKSCGLVQLIKFTPIKKLIPRYDWISYNEPEEHLDRLAKTITKLPGINKYSKVCGLSYKEDTLLKRLKKKGFKNTWRMDPKKDLQIMSKKANLETIQNKINNEIIGRLQKKKGNQDVIIVRHILEHTHDTLEFISALKKIIKNDGYIIFEVPDCTQGFKINDYNTLWEEHLIYFTKFTLNNSLKLSGLKIHYFERYKYPFESVLISVVSPNNKIGKNNIVTKLNDIKIENQRVNFSEKKLFKKKAYISKFFQKMKDKRKKIALFGTGHTACLFVNLFGLDKFINFAIDDDKNKLGYYIPGSNIKIKSSDHLKNDNIDLCILGMNFESEKKILRKFSSFSKNGGKFVSIYPSSKYAINIK